MNETLNKAFFLGHDRTSDVLEFIPKTQEGEAEIVGIFIAAVAELAERWELTEREAMDRVAKVIPED